MSTRCQIEFYDGELTDGAEPAARIYKHSDGYPSNILPMLKMVEKVLGKDLPMYGQRLDDPEWAAAEFVTMFRVRSDASKDPNHKWKHVGETDYATRGNIYVSHQIHSDIEFLYRVICQPKKWDVRVFHPVHNDAYDIVSFEPLTADEIKAAS